MSRAIQSTPYTTFYNDTDWPQELVEDFLVRGARHILVGTYGAAKSSLCLDIIGTILGQKPWLDQFAVKAPNPVIFYVSQDAGDMDLKAQSFKVLRNYFDWENEEHGALLTSRFHVVTGQNIKMPDDADAMITMMRDTLLQHEDSLEPLHEVVAPRPPRPFSVSADALLRRKENAALVEAAEDTGPVEDPEDVFEWSKYDILVIYDSARRIHNAEESQSNQMSEVSDALAEIERATGATTIVLQHENRGGTFKGDTVIMDSAQQAYQLKCPKAKRHDSVRDITVMIEKNRGLAAKPFIIRFAWTGQGTVDEKIVLSFLRWTTTEEAEAEPRSKKRVKPPVVLEMAVPVAPSLAAAREVWRPGMSRNALGKAIRAKGVKVGNDELSRLHRDLRAEGQMGLGGS